MRDKIFLLILLIFCAAIMFYFLGDSLKEKISIMKSETRQLQKISAELTKFQTRYENFAEVVDSADEKLILAQEFLPADLAEEKFVDNLYQIAENKKILINTVSVGEIQTGEVQRQTVRVRLESDYVSMLNFVREILDGERLVSLEGYSVSGGDNSEILDCELEFTIFARGKA